MTFDRHLFSVEKEIEEIDNLGSEYLDDRPAYKWLAVGTQGFRDWVRLGDPTYRQIRDSLKFYREKLLRSKS